MILEKQKRQSADVRRKQILEATFALISEKGFKSASTRMIAERAGVNEALIFRYFRSKDGLLTSIVQELKMAGPASAMSVPSDEAAFFAALKEYETFFIALNCPDPALLKIVLYAILENYPLPGEFDMRSEGTFLHWMLACIEKGKAEWGFDAATSGVEAVCLYMGGLIYYVLEAAVVMGVAPSTGKENFTALLRKALK